MNLARFQPSEEFRKKEAVGRGAVGWAAAGKGGAGPGAGPSATSAPRADLAPSAQGSFRGGNLESREKRGLRAAPRRELSPREVRAGWRAREVP